MGIFDGKNALAGPRLATRHGEAIGRGPGGVNDPWVVLRRFTQARIALGRCGSGLPTAAALEFQLVHARARDAVHVSWDLGRFAEGVRGLGVEPVTLESAVTDRGKYLRRPDLGRRLTLRSRERLAGLAAPMDVCLIVTNGLSSTAVERHGLPLLSAVLLALGARHLKAGPVVLAANGRVALSDAVGEALGAHAAAIIVGERPGLSAADSLGIYLTYGPRPRHHRRTAQLHLERTPARGTRLRGRRRQARLSGRRGAQARGLGRGAQGRGGGGRRP
jgi:ethanolamine ammonia-lyase small subunit